MRFIELSRKTKETEIDLKINLDGSGLNNIDTGIGFLNHMLELFSFHSKIDLDIRAIGDLNVDDHHTVEDIGILLGEGILKCLDDKRGIRRYADMKIPMDEVLTDISIDISGRSFLVFNVELKRDKIGDLSTEMVEEFFRAISFNSKMTIHINCLYGKNDHHKVESIFKGVAKCLKEAISIDENYMEINSSKGIL
ncbi:MAG: imidazoleglycerol-phosphate dehydratase HisB [Sarcina sp.]